MRRPRCALRGERPAVEALHERHPRLAHQRAEQAGDEVLGEALGVGVHEAHELALEHRQRAPHRIPLAEHRPVGGHQLSLLQHDGALALGQGRGAVRRGGVDDDDLVDRSRLACSRRSAATIAPTVPAHSRAGRHTDTPSSSAARSAATRAAGYAEWWNERIERRSLLALSSRRAVERRIGSTIATRGQRPHSRALERASGRGPERRQARVRGERRARPGDARRSPARAAPRRAGGPSEAGSGAPVLPSGRGRALGLAGAHDHHDGHGVGQVDVLQPAHAGRPLPRRARTRAVPVPDQGARPGPGARARRLRPDQAGAARRSTTETPPARRARRFAATPTWC